MPGRLHLRSICPQQVYDLAVHDTWDLEERYQNIRTKLLLRQRHHAVRIGEQLICECLLDLRSAVDQRFLYGVARVAVPGAAP